jgi:hypothetical protein
MQHSVDRFDVGARRYSIHFADLSVDKSARACLRARITTRWSSCTPLGFRARALQPTNRRDAVRRFCRFEASPEDAA